MQKFEVVAIHMRTVSDELKFLVGSLEQMQVMSQEQPFEIFSPVILDFWAQVSVCLLAVKKAKSLPDVVTFAFFCRKAHLLSLAKRYRDNELRLGRGVIFHIAPSNVPVNFAYSLLVGMLAGNANIVRVSSKTFEQVDLICEAIQKVIARDEFMDLRDRLCILRYERNAALNAQLSKLADVRVIWGGDTTIAEIRKAELPAKAYDITFSDRYSFALLQAEAVLADTDLLGLARSFYNDTYLFDQNACSAPRLVIWQGSEEKVRLAKAKFWAALQNLLDDYAIDGVGVIDKLVTLCEHAGDVTGGRLVPTQTNKLWRVEMERLSGDLDTHRCAAGYFLEYATEDLHEIAVAVNRKYQTLAYFGYSAQQLEILLRQARYLGIDRVVPVGRTSDFDLIWDGHDLIRSFSRVCTLW
ncbi:MAG: acyl-CoA reductase [Terracidiphilus sp.]|nr:acyl-CoA reductase [Terracidiphilus sp.]